MAVINPEWVTKEVGSFQTAEEMNTLATAVKNNAVELQTDITNLSTHINNKFNPHEVTKIQLDLENVDNVSDANKPVSIAQAAAIAAVQSDFNSHEADKVNPHQVTKAQVGLSEVDNTSDINKPVSTAQQTILDNKINLNGLNSNIDKLHFNPTTLTQLSSIGDVRYSPESKTIEVKVSDTVSIQLGQEMQTVVKNDAGIQINNGQLVYINSAIDTNALAKIASTTDADISQRTFGMATENIAVNEFGSITTEGLVRGLNTVAFSEGTMLYLGVNGAFTSTEPTAPTSKISVGMVLRSHETEGVIYVKIRAIARNQKLSDVYAPIMTNGDVLRWNNSTLRFETFNITTALDTKENIANKGIVNGYAGLDANGKVPVTQLPSYVDDVLEYASLSAFPITGESNKIYIALDTNKTYRWSGSTYVYITSGAVDSVAGKTGIVTLNKTDVGLSNVDDTSDINKPISTATQTALNLKVDKTRSIISGSGLTGGGDLSTDRTLNVASANDGITVNVDNIQLNTIDNVTTTSVTKPLSANQGKVLDEKITQVGADLNQSEITLNQNIQSAKQEAIQSSNNYTDSKSIEILPQSITPSTLSPETLALLNSGGAITNLADGEDLANVGNVIKFKDKYYEPSNYSGLAKKYLRKNIVGGVNILDQSMINDANTIYIIQYDYDLNSQTINIPLDCTLCFEGGSFKNGTLNGNNTRINATIEKIFDETIDVYGNWNISMSYPEWFGAKGDDSTDNTISFYKCTKIGVPIHLSKGIYITNIVLNKRIDITGEGQGISILKPAIEELPIINIASVGGWSLDIKLSNFSLIAKTIKTGIGIKFDSELLNSEFLGRIIIERIRFQNFNIAILKPKGNIGNVIQFCSFEGGNFHYYAVGVSDNGFMHAGADTLFRNHFQGSSIACIYIDSPQDGTGQTILRDNMLEGNPGIPIFVYQYNSANFSPSLLLDSNWLENNYTSSTVTINGNVYNTCSLYLRNIRAALIQNMNLTKIQLVNSSLKAHNCGNDDNKLDIIKDNDSYVDLSGIKCSSNTVTKELMLNSFLHVGRSAIFKTPHKIISFKLDNNSNFEVLNSVSYNYPITIVGSTSIYPILKNDGLIFPQCCEYIIPTTGNFLLGNFNTKVYKYYVYSIGIKLVNGTAPSLSFQYGGSFNSEFTPMGEQWTTVTGVFNNTLHDLDNSDIAPYLTSNGECTIRVSCFQALGFNVLEDAITYANSNVFVNKDYLRLYGNIEDRPILQNNQYGYIYYDTTLKKHISWNGSNWTESDGEISGIPRNGTYSNRPISTSSISPTNIGFMYFNTDTNRPMWYKGSDIYVYSDGTVAVS